MNEGLRLGLARTGHGMAGITAGIIVGLGHVGAAIKFSAEKPKILEILDIGRVQFGALHLIEMILVPAVVVLVSFSGYRQRLLAVVALICYLVKALAIEPGLHSRMLQRLAGANLEDSQVHLLYAVVSVLLAGLLTALAFSTPTLASTEMPHPS